MDEFEKMLDYILEQKKRPYRYEPPQKMVISNGLADLMVERGLWDDDIYVRLIEL